MKKALKQFADALMVFLFGIGLGTAIGMWGFYALYLFFGVAIDLPLVVVSSGFVGYGVVLVAEHYA